MSEITMKTALVTGASRGIGKAIALQLAKKGFAVAINYGRSAEEANAIKTQIENEGGQAILLQGDVSSTEDVDRMFATIKEVWGQLDVLVNNAGITRDNLLLRMSKEEWDIIQRVNLDSVFNLTKAAIKPMMKAKSGSIINMASVVGVKGNAGQANYAASKAGVIGFSKSVALELGSRNIRCNAIAPGFIETEMTAKLSPEVVQGWRDAIPLKRGGQTTDVANACLFLASDLSSYISGQVLNVDGGLLT